MRLCDQSIINNVCTQEECASAWIILLYFCHVYMRNNKDIWLRMNFDWFKTHSPINVFILCFIFVHCLLFYGQNSVRIRIEYIYIGWPQNHHPNMRYMHTNTQHYVWRINELNSSTIAKDLGPLLFLCATRDQPDDAVVALTAIETQIQKLKIPTKQTTSVIFELVVRQTIFRMHRGVFYRKLIWSI